MPAKKVPYSVHKAPPPTLMRSTVGFILATIFALTYLVTTPYILYSLYTLFNVCSSLVVLGLTPTIFAYGWMRVSSVFPFVLSALAPSIHSPFVTKHVTKFMIDYFQYSEIRETSDEELLRHFATGKSLILAAQPHGVIS